MREELGSEALRLSNLCGLVLSSLRFPGDQHELAPTLTSARAIDLTVFLSAPLHKRVHALRCLKGVP